MKMTVLLVPMLACCSTQGGNPEQVHSLPSPSETNVVQANVKNLLDTCDFSKGEWTFYIVEDTNLTRDRYVTSTYGSPALLLEDEKKMEAMKHTWRMTCPGFDVATCFAYLTILHDGKQVQFVSLCLSGTEEIMEIPHEGACRFDQAGAVRESLRLFEKTSVFPKRPQRPITQVELLGGR